MAKKTPQPTPIPATKPDPSATTYVIVTGTVIGGELRRKGDFVELAPRDAADLLALRRVVTPKAWAAMQQREGYGRRDMRPIEQS